MTTTQNQNTGKYFYDFTTGTTVLILKRDKFARKDILDIINNGDLTEQQRKARISRRLRILLNDTRDGTDVDEIIKAVPEIIEEIKQKQKDKASSTNNGCRE